MAARAARSAAVIFASSDCRSSSLLLNFPGARGGPFKKMDRAPEGKNQTDPGKARALFLPWLVLLFGLAATAWGTYLLWDYTRLKNEQRAAELIQQMNERLQSRMQQYISLLRGGTGLFAANRFVDLAQFRAFWQRLEIPRLYPGMQGYGFSARFPAARLSEVASSMNQQGYTNFQVWPANPSRAEYHSILYLEPLDARNLKALGFDMSTEGVRRRAMDRARDTGEPALSGRVELVQEGGEGVKQNGFLIYVPIYYGGAVPRSVEDRRAMLHGFIYSPFRAGDLLQGLYGTNVHSQLRIELYNGRAIDPNFFSGAIGTALPGDVRTFTSLHNIAGEEWTLLYKLDPSFFKGNEPLLIYSPLAGLFASLVLFYFTRSEGLGRLRLERSAREIQKQQEWLQVMLGSIGDGVISTDNQGRIEYLNPKAEELTGWPLQEASGRPVSDVFDIINEESREVVDNPAVAVLRTGHTIQLSNPSLLISRTGRELCVDDSAAPIRDSTGRQIGAILIFRDVSGRRKVERAANAQHAVARVLAEARDFPTVSRRLLQEISDELHFAWAVFWDVDDESNRASVREIFWQPNFANAEFEAACRAFHPAKGEALPGLVWASAEPLWVGDFASDGRFPRAPIAQRAGFGSAFAFPIKSEDRVQGVLEFFSREKQSRDENILRVSHSIGTQIGQFVERARAERALLESEELYRTISDTAADALILIDDESRMLSVNRATEKVFGYSREELLGNCLTMLMPEGLRLRHRQGIERYLSTGQKHIPWNSVNLPGLHKSGREVPLEVSFGATQREGKHLFVGLLRDISRRQESEAKLRESEERFRLLVSQATEYAIVTTDPQGRISTWNSGSERIFGYADAEVLGQGIELLFTSEDREKGIPEAERRTAIETGEAPDERWLSRRDGTRFWASGALFCLRNPDGTPRAFAKILRDITERKRAEEAIRQLNQELEQRVERRTAALQESKEQMEAFTYTVAHDLRAPLRAMQGFSQALFEDYVAHLDATAQDYIQRIMGSAQKMDALIQDLLAYSQLSRSDLQFTAVETAPLIAAVVSSLEDEIRNAHARVEIVGDALQVKAHPVTLTHALGNLLGNALKFTRENQPPVIVIRTVDHGESVRISVQDNGIGIAPEHHERIFRVFERLHGQDAYPGTGIGLAIVRKGIERMNGRVGVTSEPNEGSLFWIELPKAVSA